MSLYFLVLVTVEEEEDNYDPISTSRELQEIMVNVRLAYLASIYEASYPS